MKTTQELIDWDDQEQHNILEQLRNKEITPEEFLKKLDEHRVKFWEELYIVMNKKWK